MYFPASGKSDQHKSCKQEPHGSPLQVARIANALPSRWFDAWRLSAAGQLCRNGSAATEPAFDH